MTYSAVQAKSWVITFLVFLVLDTGYALLQVRISPSSEIDFFRGFTLAWFLGRGVSIAWRDTKLSSFNWDRQAGLLMNGTRLVLPVTEIIDLEPYERPTKWYARPFHPRNLSEHDLRLTTPKGKFVVLMKDDAESAVAVDWLKRLPQLQTR